MFSFVPDGTKHYHKIYSDVSNNLTKYNVSCIMHMLVFIAFLSASTLSHQISMDK